jgi:hypothetical protein
MFKWRHHGNWLEFKTLPVSERLMWTPGNAPRRPLTEHLHHTFVSKCTSAVDVLCSFGYVFVCASDSFWYLPVFIVSTVRALMSRPKVLDSEAAALVYVQKDLADSCNSVVDLGNSTNSDEENVIIGDQDDDNDVDGTCVWQDMVLDKVKCSE